MERWLEQYASVALARSSDTAHDLKAPLNVAVLNLELLRMRLREVPESEDTKVTEYTRAIDGELRRMAMVFDAFFTHVIPPQGAPLPGRVDLGAMIAAELATLGIPRSQVVPTAFVTAHEERMREMARLLCSGALRAMGLDGLRVSSHVEGRNYHAEFGGSVAEAAVEAVRLFKFYYTDVDGDAELSLATARLIAETYGGTLNGTGDGSTLSLKLIMPLGDQ